MATAATPHSTTPIGHGNQNIAPSAALDPTSDQSPCNAAVDEVENGGCAQQQHDCGRPAIGDAQHIIGIDRHRDANQDSRDSADDIDDQQPQFPAAILLSIEILDIRVPPFEVGM